MSFVIPELPADQKYWFFRTEGGAFFQEFYFNDYIAYGWDEFTELAYIKETPKDQFKESFKELYPEEKRPGLAINQMKLFVDTMKPGDVVFIPAAGSEYLAFGTIIDDVYVTDPISEEDIEAGKCPYRKRRRVHWEKHVPGANIDPYLFKLMCAINTISDATDYAPFIDRMLYPFYIKNGIGHLTLRVEKNDKISARDMAKLISGVIGLIELPDGEEQIANLDEIEVKVNVQSPGPVEFIAGAAVIWLIGAALSNLFVGGKTDTTFDFFGIFKYKSKTENEGLVEKIMKLIEQKHAHAIELQRTMTKLDVKVPKLISGKEKTEES